MCRVHGESSLTLTLQVEGAVIQEQRDRIKATLPCLERVVTCFSLILKNNDYVEYLFKMIVQN